jgi:hypothetical protein
VLLSFPFFHRRDFAKGAERMKPRHAAALALVGWYLVLPPKEGLIVKPAAPMRDWKIEQSFKTLRECEDFRHNVATATLVLENIRIARALCARRTRF